MRKRRTFTKYDLGGMELRETTQVRQEPLQDLRQRIQQESQKASKLAAACNRSVAVRVPAEVAE